MSALRSAAELFHNSDLPWDQKTNYALDVAKKFEKYVLGANGKQEIPVPSEDLFPEEKEDKPNKKTKSEPIRAPFTGHLN
jgi:hypothetical protein